MQKNYNFNGLSINTDSNDLNFLNNKCFGINKKINYLLKLRFELKKNYYLNMLTRRQKSGLFFFLFSIIPENKSIKNKHFLNIYMYDILHTYKGWRHLQGLPVNGQRTWSNAWSTYKTNLFLRNYKLLFIKKIYGNISLHEINTIMLAEQYNLLWKLQWNMDWLEAKKKRLNILKNKTAFIKVDLKAMAKGQITKIGKTAKLGKKKREIKKNVFNLGFDIGFTKKLYQLKNHPTIKSQMQILNAKKRK